MTVHPQPSLATPPSRCVGVLRGAAEFLSRYWLALAVVLSVLAAGLNWNATGMKGILPFYEDHRDVILAGGDAARATREHSPTFPMWGYGFVMIALPNQFSQIAAQLIFAVASVWFFVRYLERNLQLGAGSLAFLKILLGLSLPYWVFHAVRWPYSFAVSLLLLSVIFLHRGFQAPSGRLRHFAISGGLFGLILNLRSDFILYPVLLAAMIIGLTPNGHRSFAFQHLGVWLASVYVLLVPWMIHTSRVTGHPLLTSTNGGHVFFLGLGQHPKNFWGIEPRDGDPLMHRLVEDRFGAGYQTMQYESDKLLKQEFLSRVAAHPGQYLVKCAFLFKSLLVNGSYAGEFWGSWRESRGEPAFVPGVSRRLVTAPWSVIREFGWEFVIRLLLDNFSKALSTGVVALGVLLAPVCLWAGGRRHHLIACCCASLVLYQTALSCAGFHMPLYASNIYLACLIVIAIAVPCALEQLKSIHGKAEIGKAESRNWQ